MKVLSLSDDFSGQKNIFLIIAIVSFIEKEKVMSLKE